MRNLCLSVLLCYACVQVQSVRADFISNVTFQAHHGLRTDGRHEVLINQQDSSVVNGEIGDLTPLQWYTSHLKTRATDGSGSTSEAYVRFRVIKPSESHYFLYYEMFGSVGESRPAYLEVPGGFIDPDSYYSSSIHNQFFALSFNQTTAMRYNMWGETQFFNTPVDLSQVDLGTYVVLNAFNGFNGPTPPGYKTGFDDLFRPQDQVSPFSKHGYQDTAVLLPGANLTSFDFVNRGPDSGPTGEGPLSYYSSGTIQLISGYAPEPSSMAMVGIGLGGFGISRLRRKARRCNGV